MNLPEWCGPPVVPGGWVELDGADALTLAHEIGAATAGAPGLIGDIAVERLRVLPLPCYPDGMLVEMQARFGEERGLSNHLYGPWGLVTLDGTSAAIHDLNAIDGALALRTQEEAAAYHLLFCNVVRGDEGRFRVVAPPEEMGWKAGAAPDAGVSACLEAPVRLRRGPDGWRIHAPVFYAGALIDARFSLSDSGMIEMVEEEPVAADLAVGAERWIGQFRLPPEEERP